jgi:hypothetical protein
LIAVDAAPIALIGMTRNAPASHRCQMAVQRGRFVRLPPGGDGPAHRRRTCLASLAPPADSPSRNIVLLRRKRLECAIFAPPDPV